MQKEKFKMKNTNLTTMREISASEFKALSLKCAAVRRRSQLRTASFNLGTSNAKLSSGSLFHRLTCAAVKKTALERLQAELRALVAAHSIVANSRFHWPSRD